MVGNELELEFRSVDGALHKFTIDAAKREVERRDFREVRHGSKSVEEIRVKRGASRNPRSYIHTLGVLFENDPENTERIWD
jgi:hypothetical protein